MELKFIDNNGAIDETTRSLIRRQAARGTNLGRKVNRPSRARVLQHQSRPRPLFMSISENAVCGIVRKKKGEEEEEQDAQRELMRMSCRLEPLIGDSISVLSLPIQIAPEDRAFMHQAVAFIGAPRSVPSIEKALEPVDPIGSIYLRLMFTDQAFYHCSLAVALECAHAVPQHKTSAMRHLAQSLRLVNERISQTQTITGEIMAIVMSLSTLESTRARYDQGIIHFSGLCCMMEMRGGFAKLASEESHIAQKAYRTDLDYALRLGTATRLDITPFQDHPDMTMLEAPTRIRQYNKAQSPQDYYYPDEEFHHELGPELSHLWDRGTDLCTLINAAVEGRGAKLSTLRFMRSHIWLGHMLLNIAPLGKTRSLNRLQRMAHLGLVTLVSSFVCSLDHRVAENPIISRLIRAEAADSGPEGHDNSEVLLWLLFIGAAVVLQDPGHDAWLLPRTGVLMEELGLRTWADTKFVLQRFPWINDYYDEKGSSLFQRAQNHWRIPPTPY